MPVRVAVGKEFEVEVQVIASGLAACELNLHYDHAVFGRIGGDDRVAIILGDVAGTSVWRLRAAQPTSESHVAVEARGGNLVQRVEFPVEVTMATPSLSYESAGVDTGTQDRAMPLLTKWIERSFALRTGIGAVKLPLGYFANVIDLGNGAGLALSTDGVGTKLLVAQQAGRFDTVGIDCVAMNVNDVLCVGAEPLALLDYIAVEAPSPAMLGALAEGLYRGAEMAGVTIPGGEIAQVKEMIRGVRPGAAFDLVATCVGTVPIERILTGRRTQPGDAIVGLRSSGVHSNGLTLARRIFFDRLGWAPDRFVPELGRTIADELLEPTRIYVKPVLAMLKAGLKVRALAHITSTGFLNLSRADAPVGYALDSLPEPPPVFALIQRHGSVPDSEMVFTYNMGIGFCVVVAPEDEARVREIAAAAGIEALVIGHTVRDPQKAVTLPRLGLIGRNGGFVNV